MVMQLSCDAHVISGGSHVNSRLWGCIPTGALAWMLYAMEGGSWSGIGCGLGLTSVGVIGWHDEVG